MLKPNTIWARVGFKNMLLLVSVQDQPRSVLWKEDWRPDTSKTLLNLGEGDNSHSPVLSAGWASG